jgi:hypothetical protein
VSRCPACEDYGSEENIAHHLLKQLGHDDAESAVGEIDRASGVVALVNRPVSAAVTSPTGALREAMLIVASAALRSPRRLRLRSWIAE